ncbi:MAG: hypothetical protein ABI851_13125 [Saprospiraceae bacterium]
MVYLVNNILPIPPLKSDQTELLNQLNAGLNSRIEQLRTEYARHIPDDLQTRFLLDGRIRHNGAIDELIITPMENVNLKLWEETLQFISF